MQTNAQDTTDRAGIRGPAEGDFLRSNLVKGLVALLVVQLIAALALGLGGADLSPAQSQGPLLAFEPDKVTRLRITSADSKAEGATTDEIVLEKADAGWKIPSLGDFPVSEVKITDLLEKLAGMEKRIPVGTSENAIKRFRVGSEDFERRLVLENQDGPIGTLFLGDSPGFRRLFVRVDGDQAVYEAPLALFDVSEKADDWTRKTVLNLEQDKITALTITGMTLTRGENDGWNLQGLAEGESLDQEAVEELLGKVANLNFRGVLGTENKPEYGQDAPVLTFDVTLGEETLNYVLSKLADSEDYVLKVSNQPYYFLISQYIAKDLTEITRDKLLQAGQAPAEDTEEQAAMGTPAPEVPASDASAPDAPAPETPVSDTPAPETPVSEAPASDTPAPETPTPDAPNPGVVQ